MSPKKKPDHSPVIFQRGKIKKDLDLRNIPFTVKQQEFLQLAADKKCAMIICDGPAGVGKTLLAIYAILDGMNKRKLSDLIYIRSTIQAKDGATGYLKGDLDEKMAFFDHPLRDKLEELLSVPDAKSLIDDHRIHTMPTSMIRGHNYAAKGVILDEAQNVSFDSLITVATRMGEFSKLFILGDSRQNDYGPQSGLKKLYEIFDDEESRRNGIYCLKFDSEDIMRSKLVRYIVQKIEKLPS